MNVLRCSTSSPISTSKTPSAVTASVIDDPQQGAVLGVHRRLPELRGSHLAQALVALDGDALLALLVQEIDQPGVVLDHDGLAVAQDFERRDEFPQLLVELEEGLELGRLDQIAVDSAGHGHAVDPELDGHLEGVVLLVLSSSRP